MVSSSVGTIGGLVVVVAIGTAPLPPASSAFLSFRSFFRLAASLAFSFLFSCPRGGQSPLDEMQRLCSLSVGPGNPLAAWRVLALYDCFRFYSLRFRHRRLGDCKQRGTDYQLGPAFSPRLSPSERYRRSISRGVFHRARSQVFCSMANSRVFWLSAARLRKLRSLCPFSN